MAPRRSHEVDEEAIVDSDAEDVMPQISLSSSQNSSLNSEEDNPPETVPVAYDQEEDPEDDVSRKRSRRTSTGARAQKTRSYSSSYTFASQALNSLRRSMSGALYNSGAQDLSRQETGYSVKDIYGTLTDNEVRLRRNSTRNTILDRLSSRVQNEENYATYEKKYRDEEDKEDKEEEEEDSDESQGLDSPKVDVVVPIPVGDSLSRMQSKMSEIEQIPDTTVPTIDHGREFASIDPELVTWDGPDDPEFPRNWSTLDKSFQTGIVAFYTLISPMTSSVLSPAVLDIAESLGMEDKPFLKSFSVSVMILAWAIGPLIIAPISESENIGRRPVLNLSIWINCFFLIGCGFARTPAQLCVCRFLGGLGGCAPLNVGAGTLADLFDNDKRLVAMAFYSICPTLGPVISPVISSFIVANISWRWVFWVLAIFNAAVAVFGAIFFRETYSPKLLYNKCKRLKKETGNPHLHTIYQIADGETKWGKLYITISRPLKLLLTHPMVLGLGSFMAFTYGFMYLMLVTFPGVFEGKYGYSTEIAGLMYLPMGIGYVIGTVFFTWAINVIYHKLTERNGGVAKPEYRLPCLCFLGIGIPVGLIWYGWSAEKELMWLMPAIGTGIYAFLFIAVFQTIQNYLIDMNPRFAASSIAAAAVFRSLFGFGFPLFASSMYDKLGYGWGNTLCAFLGLALGIPFPVFCFYYGERLRNWANARMDREQAKRDIVNLRRLKKMNEEAEETSTSK